MFSSFPLFCCMCVFPSISPLDCLKFPTKCQPAKLCLFPLCDFNRRFLVVLHEKSCVLLALCGITGKKFSLGLNFTFTNDCWETSLCNGISTNSACFLSITLLSVFMTFMCSKPNEV
ncbi:hypothetical protein E1301_Tti016396 [Triplophysa tibetana]|uniref:Secreted protein n=1 Tax=Triplophysa tibetana TaxID=1572043 RepID=A0A5A9MYB4_9TELE|nr:hypothetical protein E1301_Tti016396 [Triplophysa tibetana]